MISVEKHYLLFKDAVKFVAQYGVNINYSALVGLIGRKPCPGYGENAWIVKGTWPDPRYLQISKGSDGKGCCVEIFRLSEGERPLHELFE